MLLGERSGKIAVALALGLVLTLLGCGRTQETEDKNAKKVIEVSFFEGGFGLAFFQDVARKYEKAHPGVKIHLWGDPRNGEKLRPRFIAGNPPDLVWADIPLWTLVAGDQVYPLDREMNGPAYDSKLKWRDTLYPGLVESFTSKGHIYGMPVSMNLWMIWYDKGMFEKNGWKAPKTWTEFVNLCAAMKARGIAPLAFQGRYPSYASRTMIDLVQRIGGKEAVEDLCNIKPGAWSGPTLVQAVSLIQDLVKKGYYQEGCMGMSHTESQMEFIQGRAGMVACGTWLKSEMGSAIPASFRMSSFPVPMVEGGKGDPRAMQVTNDRAFVPKEAKDPQGGADFLRFLTSEANSRDFIAQKEALGPTRVKNPKLPDALKDAMDYLNKSSGTWSYDVDDWYPAFAAAENDALNQLLTLKVTPQEFGEKMERTADKIRKDKRIIKHDM